MDETYELCYAFDALFRFLSGYPGQPAKFNIWLDDREDTAGLAAMKSDGELEILGQDWTEDAPPVLDECLHRNGEGGTNVALVIKSFLPRIHEMLTRFHAVQYCRFHSKNIADKFAVVMPVLEAHLRDKHEEKDELVYRNLEKEFFDWIDRSGSTEHQGFARKHLQVKDTKAPSLTKLLERGIAAINAKGFAMSSVYAGRLKNRRAKHFHSMPQFQEAEEVRCFYDDVRAATALLLLSTLDDLGIDISVIANRPSALRDLADIVMSGQARSGPPTSAALA